MKLLKKECRRAGEEAGTPPRSRLCDTAVGMGRHVAALQPAGEALAGRGVQAGRRDVPRFMCAQAGELGESVQVARSPADQRPVG